MHQNVQTDLWFCLYFYFVSFKCRTAVNDLSSISVLVKLVQLVWGQFMVLCLVLSDLSSQIFDVQSAPPALKPEAARRQEMWRNIQTQQKITASCRHSYISPATSQRRQLIGRSVLETWEQRAELIASKTARRQNFIPQISFSSAWTWSFRYYWFLSYDLVGWS